MRSVVKTFMTSLLVIGLLFVVFVSPSHAAVEAVKDSTWTSWSTTTFYLAQLSGPNAPYSGDVEVNITAVNKYRLWINGERVSGKGDDEWDDDEWETVETYIVSAPGKELFIGVEVQNDGVGDGNGIMVDIVAGADWLGTTTLKRRSAVVEGTRVVYPVVWFYYVGDIVTGIPVLGEKWYDFNQKKLADSEVKGKLSEVILGSMGEVDKPYNPNIEVVTGFTGNLDTGSAEGGGLMLRRIEGENIALNMRCVQLNITDGETTTSLYAFAGDPLGVSIYIDLERIQRVSKLVIYTGGSPAEWEIKSLLGFAVDISLDKFRWEEVGVIHQIGITNKDKGEYDYAEVEFPEEWVRYIRFRITETRIDYPVIGDVMVYGIGYAYDGEYESPWIDFGTPLVKNFESITLEGLTIDKRGIPVNPEGTSIIIQTKTVGADGNESAWSPDINFDPAAAVNSLDFNSPEPATKFKYRVILATMDINKTPVLKSINFRYSEEDQPVMSAEAFIASPLEKVPMGVNTTFIYALSYELISGQDLKRIDIDMPTHSTLNNVISSDTGDTLTVDNGLTYTSTTKSLSIEFTNPITDTGGAGSDTLYVSFDTKLLMNYHDFTSKIYNSSNNDDAGGIQIWENADGGSMTVITSSIIKGIISNVQAIPKVFTPNGDKTNDFTVIEFTLTKIRADIKIKVYNTKGSLVATIYDDKVDPGEWFVKNKFGLTQAQVESMDLPGYWNGEDEDGDLVPPGIYLYQVVAETDEGDKIESGTVVVGY